MQRRIRGTVEESRGRREVEGGCRGEQRQRGRDLERNRDRQVGRERGTLVDIGRVQRQRRRAVDGWNGGEAHR